MRMTERKTNNKERAREIEEEKGREQPHTAETDSEEKGVLETTDAEYEDVIETVVYVPHTPRSELRNRLQKADNTFAGLHGQPRLRFAEQSGTTIKMKRRGNPLQGAGTRGPN